MEIEDLKEAINDFDKIHTTKQIILIGVDGGIRNIELEVEDEE